MEIIEIVNWPAASRSASSLACVSGSTGCSPSSWFNRNSKLVTPLVCSNLACSIIYDSTCSSIERQQVTARKHPTFNKTHVCIHFKKNILRFIFCKKLIRSVAPITVRHEAPTKQLISDSTVLFFCLTTKRK